MTDRATFGDFLLAARRHVQAAAESRGHYAPDMGIFGVSQSLGRLVAVMAGCVQDCTAPYGNVRTRQGRALNVWAQAGVEAREALGHAARFLHQVETGQRRRRAASEYEHHLDAAADSLSAGRDLLATHFILTVDGSQRPRSEWALAIASPRTTRALLVEIAAMARQIAPAGADRALPSPGESSTVGVRRRPNRACKWLLVLNATVRQAHAREPVTAADTMLLHAIPVNVLPPRRVPETADPVLALCDGVIASAERVRHLAWRAAEQASWSPGMSATSLHQVAAASTVVSHNCHVVLMGLASRTELLGFGAVGADLLAAADEAELVRDLWRGVAGTVDRINTDSRRHVSQAAAEARDLAMWTGRLAYADQDWTAASGPGKAARLPEDLAPDPAHARMVVAAVHHASHTLNQLTRAEHEEVRAAAQAGRILVATRSLPDDFDISRPFARAPQGRVDALLGRYRDAGAASREATAAVAVVAEATRGPSRVLTAAEAAIEGRPGGRPGREALPDRAGAGEQSDAWEPPGPVERTVLDLGVTEPEILRRAAELDSASERLIMDATRLAPSPGRCGVPGSAKSVGRAALVNHALASDDSRSVALRGTASAERGSPDREP